MIIQTISNVTQFRDAFVRCGRKNQFSYDALDLLFYYFDDVCDSVELDPVGICCDFCEMDEGDVIANYNLDEDQNVESFLEHNTLLIGKTDSGRFVFAQF